MRYAYGTLGPLLFGQANSNFNDSDSAMESLEFGGLIGDPGPARIPQIRWTSRWAAGACSARCRSRRRPTRAICGRRAPAYSAPTRPRQHHHLNWTATIPAGFTVPAGFSTTPVNPLKSSAPNIVAAWYIPQPWGHVDFAAVVRPISA